MNLLEASKSVDESVAAIRKLVEAGFKFSLDKTPEFKNIKGASSMYFLPASFKRFEEMAVGEVDILTCYRRKNVQDHDHAIQYLVKKRGSHWASTASGIKKEIKVSFNG